METVAAILLLSAIGLFMIGIFSPKTVRMSRKKTTLISVILLGGFFAFAPKLTPEQIAEKRVAESKENQANQDKDNLCTKKDYQFEPFTIAQDAIKSQLKNPDGADFASIRESTIERKTDKEFTKCGFVVTSYVTATNSFGAPIRSKWAAIVDSDGNGFRVVMSKIQ